MKKIVFILLLITLILSGCFVFKDALKAQLNIEDYKIYERGIKKIDYILKWKKGEDSLATLYIGTKKDNLTPIVKDYKGEEYKYTFNLNSDYNEYYWMVETYNVNGKRIKSDIAKIVFVQKPEVIMSKIENSIKYNDLNYESSNSTVIIDFKEKPLKTYYDIITTYKNTKISTKKTVTDKFELITEEKGIYTISINPYFIINKKKYYGYKKDINIYNYLNYIDFGKIEEIKEQNKVMIYANLKNLKNITLSSLVDIKTTEEIIFSPLISNYSTSMENNKLKISIDFTEPTTYTGNVLILNNKWDSDKIFDISFETLPEIKLNTFDSTNVALNQKLSWNATDLDGDEILYDIYLSKNKNLEKIETNYTKTEYYPKLLSNTKYYWKVVAKDGKHEISSNIFSFSTTTPPKISLKSPKNGSVDNPLIVTLEWDASDDNNNELKYDIYFGKDKDPKLFKNNLTNKTFTTDILEEATYYWKVVAKNSKNASTASEIWTFTTIKDSKKPVLISPENYATNVSLNPKLTWGVNYPGELKYAIQFGDSEMTTIATGINETSYQLNNLKSNTTYYWNIISYDNDNIEYTSSAYSFTTTKPPIWKEIQEFTINENETLEINLLDYVTDENNRITFSIVSGKGIINESLYTWTPTLDEGDKSYDIVIKATDIYGATSTATITINVKNINVDIKNLEIISPQIDQTNVIPYNVKLKWKVEPESDLIKFDIYFGENLTLIATDVTKTEYEIGNLSFDKKYYWKIIAKEPFGSIKEISGNFTTIKNMIKWKFETGNVIFSSPAIGIDGTVFVGSVDNYLYAINPNGSLKWKFEMGYYVTSSPTIGTEGTIFVGSGDYYIYAINSDGSLKWKFETGNVVSSSPAIGADGTIFVGSYDNYIYAINPDGTLKWKFKTGYYVNSSPAIGADGTIFVGSYDNYLYAINPDGTLKWKFKTGYYVNSSPAIGADGTIFVGSYDNYLYAINPDGTLKWKFKTGYYVNSSPAIGADGTVFVGSGDNYIYAINPDGTLKWKFETGDYVFSSPAIGADGTIFVGSYDNYLYAINPDGSLKWKFRTENDVRSSPTIGADGTVFVGSYDNYLYAINSNSKGPLESNWAKFRSNKFNNGNPYISQCNSELKVSLNSPADNSILDDSYIKLSWNVESNDSTHLKYSVYLGEDLNNLSKIANRIEENYYYVSLKFNTTYYWKIVMHDYYFDTVSDTYTFKVNDITAWNVTISENINDNFAYNSNILYFISKSGILYAYDVNGNKKWEYSIGTNVNASPVIGKDNSIIVADGNGKIYAISADGNLKWEYETEGMIYSSPAIGNDGCIYIGTSDYIYALSDEGTFKWKKNIYGAVKNSPVIDQNGNIYFFNENNYLYVINPNGDIIYTNNLNLNTDGYFALSDNNRIYFIEENILYCYDLSNNEIWKYYSENNIVKGVVIDIHNNIYFGDDDGYLYKLDKNGDLLRRIKLDSKIISIPVLSAKNYIYIGLENGEIRKYSLEFELYGKYVSDKAITNMFLLDNGNLIFGSEKNHIISIDFKDDGLMKSSWPMARRYYTGINNFMIISNSIPETPKIISPDEVINSGITDVELEISWKSSDPDGDYIKYDIYFGKNSEPKLYKISYESTSIYLKNLDLDTTYYLKIIAKDSFGGSSESIIYSFKTRNILKAKISVDGAITTTPAIWIDGSNYIVYFTTENSLYSITPDGTINWTYNATSTINTSPVLGNDGTIYINDGNYLLSIDKDGIKNWEYNTSYNISYTPAIGKDGNIYVQDNYNLYKISNNGSFVWKEYLSNYSYSYPVIDKNGNIIIGITNYIKSYYSSGYNKWSKYYGYYYYFYTFSLGAEHLYVGSDENLIALDLNGNEIWRFNIENKIESAPIIDDQGNIYFGANNGYFYALDASGNLKWKYYIGGSITSDAVIGKDRTIYVGSNNGYLYAIKPDGTMYWRFKTDGAIYGGITLFYDGNLYFGDNAGNLYILNVKSKGLMNSPWPKIHKNLLNNGRQ
ncbi:hypothetical protein X275_00755 [Marinitoga sp. 1197]|uniref:outer membrane protein assembly factor BamB family protein n=1 Tax=Marinitoga sp. 1197 TaxID=1428449 RepID=UPI000658F2AA|nr:PQQ-binding-like beta-propeller repeat protein [Marinitoga sp. 1197]KLO24247.1 hypothetical protein X275_00755 [Marinitoga sp. 1197]